MKVNDYKRTTHLESSNLLIVAHQQEIQSLLRSYLECRRKAEPVKEKQVIAQNETGENKAETGQEHQNMWGAFSTEPPEDESFPQVAMMEVEQQAGRSTLDHANNVNANSQSPAQSAEPKASSCATEARGLITRLAILIDEWVQNCEEKVNLTKAAYDSVSKRVYDIFEYSLYHLDRQTDTSGFLMIPSPNNGKWKTRTRTKTKKRKKRKKRTRKKIRKKTREIIHVMQVGGTQDNKPRLLPHLRIRRGRTTRNGKKALRLDMIQPWIGLSWAHQAGPTQLTWLSYRMNPNIVIAIKYLMGMYVPTTRDPSCVRVLIWILDGDVRQQTLSSWMGASNRNFVWKC